MTITRFDMTPEVIEELVNRRVEEALAAHEVTRAANALETMLLRLKTRAKMAVTTIMGMVEMETVEMEMEMVEMEMEMVGMEIQMRMEEVWKLCFTSATVLRDTLLDSALTWWNSHKRTIGTDVAYALSWRELLKLMTEVYCPRNEIQKMETELWNLSVKNNDMATYTQRFQELTMMCTKMVPEEEDRVEKFIGGLPDNIQGNVIAAEPTRLQDVVRIANNLMDQKLKGYAVRNTKNKRRLNNNYRNNRGQQPPHKRQNIGGQNVARAYMAGNNEKNGYEGTLPFCNKCKLHHEGQYTAKCRNYKRIRHLARDADLL
ncbi:reverse transcriptase domain-containing protein [Tanacetum coccineum]